MASPRDRDAPKLVIFGSGGHGRELADLARACQAAGGSELVGFLDDDPARRGTLVAGLPVLGDGDWLRGRPDIAVVVGIGSPAAKRGVVERLAALGARFSGLVHPRAEISPSARLGVAVVITAGCVVTCDAVLGEHVHLNRSVNVSHDCRVGDFAHLAPGAVLCGTVTVGPGCDIGANACVIPNITVGAWTVIGAGAAVVADLPAHVTAVGVPARIVKRHALARAS